MADQYVSEGVPFLRSQNVRPFRIDTDELKFIPSEFHGRLRKCALSPGDVVVVRTGYPGTAAVIPDFIGDANCADLVVITPGPELDPYFLCALFNSTWGIASVAGRLVGSAQQHFNIGAARQMEVHLPPVESQHKIAALLSAYDDLFENNRRRIGLLEEMAQRIYREWFVDFRYPGHEGAPTLDSEIGSIPRGWHVGRLGDVVNVNQRSVRTLDDFRTIEYIDIASVREGTIEERKVLAADEAPGRARRLVRSGDIIWSTVRPNLRAFALLLDPSPNCVVSTGFAVLSAKKVPMAYLYAVSRSDSFVEYLVNHTTGAAYPAVTGRTFEAMPLLVPSQPLLARYESIADPAVQMAAQLRKANELLTQSRDLLLPRLVTGEIDVEGLDITMEEAAA